MKRSVRWASVLLLLIACAAHRHLRPLAPGQPATHDIDERLEAVLETASLEGACEAWKAGDTSESTRLRCGKQMFFRETFGTVGIPESLLAFSQRHYVGYFGRGFSSLGLIADPASEEGMPIGLAPSRSGTVAFTCAACHFGRLPDGRYAVGFGNTRFEYGRFIASLGPPLQLSFNLDEPAVLPELRQRFGPHVTEAKAHSGYGVQAAMLGTALLVRGQTAPFSLADQERYLKLPAGVLDFLTPPMLDDGAWTPSRVLSLWSLPTAQQRANAHMPSQMLSWNGGVPTIEVFLDGFVTLALGSTVDRADLAPLAAYVQHLQTPSSPFPVDEEGRALFQTRGCAGCHDGPSGESTRVFAFSELGTDSSYANIYGPKPDGTACCGLDAASPYITRGIKAPRLAGVWSAARLLHDGSVGSLEELFCLTPRVAPGHRQTCDGLSDDEKHALIRTLRSW